MADTVRDTKHSKDLSQGHQEALQAGMARQLIILASALVLAISMHTTDATMARITCHCESGDVEGAHFSSHSPC